jgi:hypothetical protein
VYSASDRATTVAPLATEQVFAWLKSDAMLAAAVQQVSARDSLAAQQNQIADLSRGLDVQPDATRPTQFGWQVTCQHRDRQLATRLLNALSESLKSQLKQLDQAEAQLLVQHYQKSLQTARDEEDVARQALERARHEQMLVARQVSPHESLPYVTPPSPAQIRANVNPAWEELQQRVLIAKTRLDQLLSARTAVHPQVIEAQSQLSQLEELLNRTPREPGVQLPKADAPAPDLNGPQLQGAANGRLQVTRLVSSTEDALPRVANAANVNLSELTSRWSVAATKRAAIERSWNEAQQQWVRGLNSEGWQVSSAWTQAQLGGRGTMYQLLLAGAIALCAGLGTWRLTWLALRDGALTSAQQLAETLPLPVIGAISLTTDFPKRLPERMNVQLLRLTQLSLAAIATVLLVIAWSNSIDANLGSQWTSDPLSALGQSFDLLHHRWLG